MLGCSWTTTEIRLTVLDIKQNIPPAFIYARQRPSSPSAQEHLLMICLHVHPFSHGCGRCIVVGAVQTLRASPKYFLPVSLKESNQQQEGSICIHVYRELHNPHD